MMSLKRSDSEWIPSAIIAVERPMTPARILKTVSTMLTTEPTSVTKVTFDVLSIMSIVLGI